MADKKISELTALTSAQFATDDLFAVVDTSATETKKTTIADLDARYASSGVTQYTDELAQDAVGTILVDSATIDLTYTDGTPSITASVIAGSIGNTQLGTGLDASKIGSGGVSSAEFDFLANVSSDIQTQINGKASTGHTQAASTITDFNEAAQDAVGGILTDSASVDFTYDDVANTITAIVVDGSISNAKVATGIDAVKIADGSVTNAEFQFINTLSSNAQTQLDGKISTTLADGNILVGNASNVATSVNPSGDIDVSNTGVFSIASGVVVDADISGSAAISFSKLAALSSTNILVGNASNVATAVAMSADGTLSNAGALTIANGVVTYAKMQTFGANKMIANNTASTAAPAEHVFISKSAATLSSTITWTGTTAPSGSQTFEYGFQQTGNKVSFWIVIKYSVAGSALQAVAIEFPGDMPTPYEPVGLTAASEKLYSITGMIDSASTGSAGVCRAWIRRNSADTNYEAFVQTGSGTNNSILAWFNGQYFTS